MKIPLDKFENYLINKNLKPRSVKNYVYYFNKFSGESFSQEGIARFLSDKANRNSNSRSFLRNLKRFLLLHHKELQLTDDIKAEIYSVELPQLTGRTKKKVINPIPHEQIPALEANLRTEKQKLQLLLTYHCGLRLGELLTTKIVSFDWDKWGREMSVNNSSMGECKVFGKGSKEGLALVPAWLMKRIAQFIHTQPFSLDSYLFVIPGKNLKLVNLERVWQRDLGVAGINSGITKLDENKKPIEGTQVNPHRLRHSYGTHLIVDLGMDMKEVKELLRHKDISSTDIYVHVSKEHLKKKLLEKGG